MKVDKKAKKELLLATLVIYFIHGCWDAIISLIDYFANVENQANADVLGGILFISTILFGIIYIVFSIIKIKRVCKKKTSK